MIISVLIGGAFGFAISDIWSEKHLIGMTADLVVFSVGFVLTLARWIYLRRY